MAKILSDKQVAEMFKTYSENPSISAVAKRFKVSWSTVNKYKFVENWDGRLKKIREQVQQTEDYDVAKALAENLKIIRTVKGYLIQLLTEFIGLMKVGESSMTDQQKQRLTYLKKQLRMSSIDAAFDRLIRLEGFLMGTSENGDEGNRELTVEEAVMLLDERDKAGIVPQIPEPGKKVEDEQKA